MIILGEDNFERLKASTSSVSNNKIIYNEDDKSSEGMDFFIDGDVNINFFTYI